MNERSINGVLKPVWVCAPATALNVLLFAIPVVYFAGISFLQIRGFKLVAEPTLANYGRTITDYGSVVLATLGLSSITAAATTILGFIYAAACRFFVNAGCCGSDYPVIAGLVRWVPRETLCMADHPRSQRRVEFHADSAPVD